MECKSKATSGTERLSRIDGIGFPLQKEENAVTIWTPASEIARLSAHHFYREEKFKFLV